MSFTWLPTWRHARSEIEIVESPIEAWFADKHHTRFCVLTDGTLWWGDSEHVVHGDLTRVAPATGRGFAVAAGVLMKYRASWYLTSCEFAPWIHDDDRKDAERLQALLGKLTTWQKDTANLGTIRLWGRGEDDDVPGV